MYDHINSNATSKKTIEVLVSPQGETTITTSGFIGAECQAASRYLEQALGTRSSEQLTPEFYRAIDQRTQVREET